MYAIVRESTFGAAKLAQGGRQLAAFQDLHSRQPGYRGSVVVIRHCWTTACRKQSGGRRTGVSSQAMLRPARHRTCRGRRLMRCWGCW